MNTVIKDYDGQSVKYDNGDEFTFKSVARLALNNSIQGEEIDGEQKVKMFELSVKLGSADEVELSLDEANLIKERAAKTVPSPLLYGTIASMLEEASSPK